MNTTAHKAAWKLSDTDDTQQLKNNYSLHLLNFRTGTLNVCVDLKQVVQVMHLVAIQPLPGSADFVAGVINYHGTMAPVIDLSRRLGLPFKDKYSLDTPMIICKYQERIAALIVSEICNLVNVPAVSLQMKDVLKETGAAFSAVVQLDDGPAVILNPATILDVEADLDTDGIINKLTDIKVPADVAED